MNTLRLQDIVNGKYGRKIAYANVETITENNVVSVVGKTIGIHNSNKAAIDYLWNYKNGDQPALYRIKVVRDDLKPNNIVENHAWEIVQFKNAQTNGEPMQCVSLKQDDSINVYVDRFNDYCRSASKHRKDIDAGEWTSAVGTSYKAIQRKNGKTPFRIVVCNPLTTYIVYSKLTGEPILSVQELKDEENHVYYHCFSETHEFKIQNSILMPLSNIDGTTVYSRLHAFGGIPIVEYPNNQDRISDIELVISMLDAINEVQSNRVDSIAQFVQSWVKFVNCDIDEETFQKMKMMGALTVKSNNGENKADVDIMSQELKQSETQVAKDDIWDNVLSISAIPNKQGNTGGDTQGAVELRNGWDFSKQRAKLKDPYIIEAEKQLSMIILNVIRIAKGDLECPLEDTDFNIQIVHSPTDNMLVKTQALQLMLQMGINPLIAIQTCGLWSDAEKVFLNSRDYLDVIYKTIDEVENAEEQKAKAQEILKQVEGGVVNA